MKTGMRHEATGKNAKLFGVALCALLFALSVPAQASNPNAPLIEYQMFHPNG